MDIAYIIQKPIVTEKSLARIASGKYSFLVHPDATKFDIARAVSGTFDVTVERVTVINRKGKEKRVFRKRHTTKTPDKKVAIVTLGAGQKIDIFSEFDAEAVETEKPTEEENK